jgi:hypothetical protein
MNNWRIPCFAVLLMATAWPALVSAQTVVSSQPVPIAATFGQTFTITAATTGAPRPQIAVLFRNGVQVPGAGLVQIAAGTASTPAVATFTPLADSSWNGVTCSIQFRDLAGDVLANTSPFGISVSTPTPSAPIWNSTVYLKAYDNPPAPGSPYNDVNARTFSNPGYVYYSLALQGNYNVPYGVSLDQGVTVNSPTDTWGDFSNENGTIQYLGLVYGDAPASLIFQATGTPTLSYGSSLGTTINSNYKLEYSPDNTTWRAIVPADNVTLIPPTELESNATDGTPLYSGVKIKWEAFDFPNEGYYRLTAMNSAGNNSIVFHAIAGPSYNQPPVPGVAPGVYNSYEAMPGQLQASIPPVGFVMTTLNCYPHFNAVLELMKSPNTAWVPAAGDDPFSISVSPLSYQPQPLLPFEETNLLAARQPVSANITPYREMNGWQYRVQVENAPGSTAVSQSANLTVKLETKALIQSVSGFVPQNSYALQVVNGLTHVVAITGPSESNGFVGGISSVPIGTTVNATCAVEVDPTDFPYSLQWKRRTLVNGNYIYQDIPGATTGTFSMTVTDPSQAGDYVLAVTSQETLRFTGFGQNPANTFIEQAFNLRVTAAAPQWGSNYTLNGANTNLPSVAVRAGSSVTLAPAIAVVGSPAPSYQWYLGQAAISGATSATLSTTFNSISPTGSNITCVATNSVGNATWTRPLSVLPATAQWGPNYTLNGVVESTFPVTVMTGESITLTPQLFFAGTPSSTYQWYIGTTAIKGATSLTLTVASVPTTWNGLALSIVATNSAGTAKSTPMTVSIVLPPKPTVTPNQARYAGIRNGNVSATVTVTPPGNSTVIQWLYNGRAIKNSANYAGTTTVTLKVIHLLTTTEGTYTVKATDAGGSGTSTPIMVGSVPTISRQPAALITVKAGGTTSMRVTPVGTAPLTYQWLSGNGTINLQDQSATSTSAQVKGSHTAVLSLLKVRASDAGIYKVKVSNSYGNVLSVPVQLVVK